MATEVLPATFPNRVAAALWGSKLDPAKAKFLEVVPSQAKPGRFQVKVRRP